jgi:hypothetical protein
MAALAQGGRAARQRDWLHGGTVIQQHGSKAAWQHGSVSAAPSQRAVAVAAGLDGCFLAAWVHGCMAAWLHGCMAAWLHGCMAAWLHCCVAVY